MYRTKSCKKWLVYKYLMPSMVLTEIKSGQDEFVEDDKTRAGQYEEAVTL